MNLARMEPLELLEDVEAATKPDCPSGVRNRTRASVGTLCYEEQADDRLGRLAPLCASAGRRATVAKDIAINMRKCRDEFRSWARCAPTDEVRRNTITRFLTEDGRFLDLVMGSR